MFDWIKSSSPWNKVRLNQTGDQICYSTKRKVKSSVSLSLDYDMDASINLEPEDSFSIAKKPGLSSKSKRISKRIISMFQGKSKDVNAEREKNRSTVSLLDSSLDMSFGPEWENDEAARKTQQRSQKPVRRIFSAERRGRLFKRKPLDDYAKRKLQISRDSGWGAVSSCSSSLSSLVNEAAFCTSSPIAKAGTKESRPRFLLTAENSGAIVRRKMMLLSREHSRRSSGEISKSEEELDNDKSFVLSDSGICVSGSSSTSNDFVRDQSECPENILDKLGSSEFARSFDCLAHLPANVKTCEECDSSCDAPRSQGEDGGSEKVSSRGSQHSKELRTEQRGNSVSYVSQTPLKNVDRPVNASADPARFDSRKSGEVKDFRDARDSASLERCRSIMGNSSKRNRSWISRSTDELLDDNSFVSSDDIPEFNSLTDLPWASLRDCAEDYEGCFVNPALDESDEENSSNGSKVQSLSLHFDCDQDNSARAPLESFNSSYVITMYV